MTRAIIRRIAKEAGVDMSLIKITKIGGVYGFEDQTFLQTLQKGMLNMRAQASHRRLKREFESIIGL